MKIESPNEGSYIGSAGALHATSKRACLRAMQEGIHHSEVHDNSLTAVILSCATLEAYINEAFMLLQAMPELLAKTEDVRAFADILSEIEKSRGSTRLKYLMGLTVLTGQPFSKGEYPYQDFDLLFAIRDELMHHKLERLSDEPHKLVKRLRSKGLCAEEKGVKQSWRGHVFTPATAKWACNISADMINTMQKALFESAEKDEKVSMLKVMASITYTKVG